MKCLRVAFFRVLFQKALKSRDIDYVSSGICLAMSQN